jgi:hypothetical protein
LTIRPLHEHAIFMSARRGYFIAAPSARKFGRAPCCVTKRERGNGSRSAAWKNSMAE